jgi:hypothetical protein
MDHHHYYLAQKEKEKLKGYNYSDRNTVSFLFEFAQLEEILL